MGRRRNGVALSGCCGVRYHSLRWCCRPRPWRRRWCRRRHRCLFVHVEHRSQVYRHDHRRLGGLRPERGSRTALVACGQQRARLPEAAGHVTDAEHERRVEKRLHRVAAQSYLDGAHTRRAARQRVSRSGRRRVHLSLRIPLDDDLAGLAAFSAVVSELGAPQELFKARPRQVQRQHARLSSVLHGRPAASIRHPDCARLDPRHSCG
mmetsp:Transcript_23221/g.59089  ORF Transcript_23221/g.59089 Transcript_23221/m.59089 type:complete len:207 (-) Transcript_23221:200-820(-)